MKRWEELILWGLAVFFVVRSLAHLGDWIGGGKLVQNGAQSITICSEHPEYTLYKIRGEDGLLRGAWDQRRLGRCYTYRHHVASRLD